MEDEESDESANLLTARMRRHGVDKHTNLIRSHIIILNRLSSNLFSPCDQAKNESQKGKESFREPASLKYLKLLTFYSNDYFGGRKGNSVVD